jgi:hypothetical protein
MVRTRRARRTALGRLKRARKAGLTDARRFYDEAAGALGGYLSDRFNLPEIAVAGDTLKRTMAEKSIEGAVIEDTLACLQECDFGRFVSASLTPEKMAGIVSRIRKIIDILEQAG